MQRSGFQHLQQLNQQLNFFGCKLLKYLNSLINVICHCKLQLNKNVQINFNGQFLLWLGIGMNGLSTLNKEVGAVCRKKMMSEEDKKEVMK